MSVRNHEVIIKWSKILNFFSREICCFQRSVMQKGGFAKAFLSDASQPEMRLFVFEYALTLQNFVLLSVFTLK